MKVPFIKFHVAKRVCTLLFLGDHHFVHQIDRITHLTYLAMEALGTPILNTSSLHGLECRTLFKRGRLDIGDDVVLMVYQEC